MQKNKSFAPTVENFYLNINKFGYQCKIINKKKVIENQAKSNLIVNDVRTQTKIVMR